MQMELDKKQRQTQAHLQANTHLLTVDGLFAGFSFTGALQIFAMNQMNELLLVAAGSLVLATLLFAFRISIAIRLVTTIHTCSSERYVGDSPTFLRIANRGRKIEFAGIVFFWCSLIPLSFNSSWFLGYFTTVTILLAFFAYARLCHLWNKSNQELGTDVINTTD